MNDHNVSWKSALAQWRPIDIAPLISSGSAHTAAEYVKSSLFDVLLRDHLPAFWARVSPLHANIGQDLGSTGWQESQQSNIQHVLQELTAALQDLWSVIRTQAQQLQALCCALLLQVQQPSSPAANPKPVEASHISPRSDFSFPSLDTGPSGMQYSPATPTTLLSFQQQNQHQQHRQPPGSLAEAGTSSQNAPRAIHAGSAEKQWQKRCDAITLCGTVDRYSDAAAALIMQQATVSFTGLLRRIFLGLLSLGPGSLMSDDNDIDSMVLQQHQPPVAALHDLLQLSTELPDSDDALHQEYMNTDGNDDSMTSLPHLLCKAIHLLHCCGVGSAAKEAAADALALAVRQHCAVATQQGLDTEALPPAWQYLEDVPLPFVRCLLVGARWGAITPLQLEQEMEAWRQRLVYAVYEAVGAARLGSMWECVVDYPESLPAVQDMAACLQHTSMQQHFVNGFRSVVARRLLHPGASAQDMVHTYVALIRVLTTLDSSGVLLSQVAGPVRRYLRSRPDAVRCVVAAVTGNQGGGGQAAEQEDPGPSLLEEAQREDEVRQQSSAGGSIRAGGRHPSGSRNGAAGLPYWDEDKVLALLTDLGDGSSKAAAGLQGALSATNMVTNVATGATASSAEVVDMLVAVFPSKEHFVEEYRSCLARELLQAADYDASRALGTVELLKIRFGDTCMHACEVMLKDVADAKRINTAVHAANNATTVAAAQPPAWLSAIITSHLFWPQLGGWGDKPQQAAGPLLHHSRSSPAHAAERAAEARLVLPGNIMAGLQAYSDQFRAVKAPRQLHWRPHVGVVELQVEIGGVAVDFQVSPLLATLLMAFEQEDALSVQQLSQKVGLPTAIVRRRILFWVEAGILEEALAPPSAAAMASIGGSAPLVYRRATSLDASKHGSHMSDAGLVDEALLAAGRLAGHDALEEMAPYEPYLLGILLNTGGLPLDRLHTMLKRFVVSPKYDKTIDQLAQYLAALVTDGKLVVVGGVYKRKPAAAQPSENV